LQQNLVDWWRENVSVRHGAGQGTEGSKNADRRSLISIEAAEDISGISHQKVSKWRGYLKATATNIAHCLRGTERGRVVCASPYSSEVKL
jgi:hypothetical protein